MPNYTYPDSLVLKNKFGIRDANDLARVEATFVAARGVEIAHGNGPTEAFDRAYLTALHKHLFQDVYEWAGHTRNDRVVLSDGTTVADEQNFRKIGGKPFLAGSAIPGALDRIASDLQSTAMLRGLPREEFAEQAADIMSRINAVHPFREGNGRTQRLFVEMLARQAGHTLDFRVVSKERMIQASIAANETDDPSMMRRLFDEISDPDRVAMLQRSIGELERLGFDWNERYIATLDPDHPIEVILAGVAGDQFMARTSDKVLFGRTSELPDPPPERDETFRYGR